MVHGLPVFDLWSVGLEIHKLNSQHRLTELEILGIKYRLGKKKDDQILLFIYALIQQI